MAMKYALIDEATGNIKRGLQASTGALFVDQKYEVGSGGQQNFPVTQPFLSGTLIDVFVNGILMDEGSTNDYQRNVTLNRIEFNNNVPTPSKVRIRVYGGMNGYN